MAGRDQSSLGDLWRKSRVVQFGGAVGTLAALENKGIDVAGALGEELHLVVPDVPWHGHRDRVGEVVTTLGLCTGTLGKIARDIALLMQTEVAEAFEPVGEGARRVFHDAAQAQPVTAAVVLAAATRVPGLVSSMFSAMVLEHERGLGG